MQNHLLKNLILDSYTDLRNGAILSTFCSTRDPVTLVEMFLHSKTVDSSLPKKYRDLGSSPKSTSLTRSRAAKHPNCPAFAHHKRRKKLQSSFDVPWISKKKGMAVDISSEPD